jgi:hypothetical protein
MQCQECKEQILELVYEEGIRPRRKLELLDHVDSCPLCHEEYTELLESRAILQEWPDENITWNLQVRPDLEARFLPSSRFRRWLPSGPIWPRQLWPVFQGAFTGLLLLVAVLAISQSAFTWNEHGLTVQARLWKSRAAPVAANAANQQQLLELVDRMIAASEERQNRQFSNALYQVWEDLQMKSNFEHQELQTGFRALQKQSQDRWEHLNRTTQ